MNAQEEKELKRVFDHLAGFSERKKLTSQMKPKRERKAMIENFKKNFEATRVLDVEGKVMTVEEVNKEYENLQKDMEHLENKIASINSNPAKRISSKDLYDCLKALGKTSTTAEIHEMIWEADEDLDQHISWEELKDLFQRCITDKTGLEPTNLFNVVQFMTYDKEFRCKIKADDTMAMLFARYGKAKLEKQMKVLFGNGKEELFFMDYLAAVTKRPPAPTTVTK